MTRWVLFSLLCLFFNLNLFAAIPCPSCGQNNNDEDRYCLNCAAEIRDLSPEEKEIRQKNAGKIEYQGKYYTLEEYQKITTQSAPVRKTVAGAKISLISQGEEVELSRHAVKGAVTVFDFYADWCGPCRALSPSLEAFVQERDGVYLKKIDIVNWSSQVSKQHQIQSIPCILVYDKNGAFVEKLGSDFIKIKASVEKALQ